MAAAAWRGSLSELPACRTCMHAVHTMHAMHSMHAVHTMHASTCAAHHALNLPQSKSEMVALLGGRWGLDEVVLTMRGKESLGGR
mmetsp:Transcript_66372/g.148190  ORF Transcript_66372/g.148190 Transcript_66372/m.148190 type:complete len:85 (-) Transcript_66372:7-261(-)